MQVRRLADTCKVVRHEAGLCKVRDVSTTRRPPRAYVDDLRFLLRLRCLSPRVSLFLLRARRYAFRTKDDFSIRSAIRPDELAAVLQLAHGRRMVVELGTGTGWSAIALALDDPARRVVTYDPCVRTSRYSYTALAGPRVFEQIEFREAPDSDGPHSGERCEFLFIDSSHDHDSVVAAFRAWEGSLDAGAIVVFHDYGHPQYPGVEKGIRSLSLTGEQRGALYVHHVRGSISQTQHARHTA